ncbi:M48 family metallopeptidase [Candidatus Woesearchaeota archaeon]|nr:M48 family metallopeptidase [Candidatus Woesearchaeota archaeon]
MKTDFIIVNEVKHPVLVSIEKRSVVSVRIGKRAITIKVPSSLNRDEMAREILKMKMWAKQKLSENPEILKKDVYRTYQNKDLLKVGNQEYLLNIDFKDKSGSSARIEGNSIFLTISSNISESTKAKHISSLISRCVANKRIDELKLTISGLNLKHFNQKMNKIFFKNNKSNWGSCSRSGNINISTRLLFAPIDVLEYVCIHELAHLIEHNHSPGFWELVEKAMPDYQEKEAWLKENGSKCTF